MSYIPPPTPTFEKDRIRALKNERINSQKKTFTKWVNSFLDKHNSHVDDLFTDLSDGRLLISLLEIISGEKLGKIARGKLRVHKIENVNKALEFLQCSVKLESIGAEDIVDGNERLILAVIWMIILRFQIADISYQDEMSQEKKSAKEALLLWCQRMTRGYPGVDIQNFTTSWRNGLAFNALIHKHRPDIINYGTLRPSQHEANLNNAFNVAEERLGIAKLLDAEDVDCPRPDEKSIMTYVSMYYQYFAKMKTEETGGRRIAKILGILMEVEQMEKTYEQMVSDLLNWLNTKIVELGRPFQKSMLAVQREMALFKHFRTVEKPPKYSERVNIEAHLFSLQTKRKGNNQQPYIPPEGKLVMDINRAWQVMESAEHDREMALRQELIRQEMLEKLADKFERKASLRESWLDDMMHVLEGEALGQDAATVEAAFKRHEAISTDVKAREERFQMVFDLAQELIDEDYHRSDVICAREEVIMTKWDKLIGMLEAKRSTLVGFKDLVGLFREMDGAHGDMQDIESAVRSEDYGKHLLDVENLLHKHSLIESQIQSQGESVQRINNVAQRFIKAKHLESRVIKERQSLLAQAFEALEAELSGRFAHCETVCAKGQSLVDRSHYASKEIRAKIKQLQNNWMKLRELLITRSERLKDAAQSLQYYSDSNDAESWMKEKMYVASSEDYGRDEQSAVSLLQRHTNVIDEIKGFADDMNRLREQSKLMESNEQAVQGFERDLAAVEEKLVKLQDQAKSLVSHHPRQARQIKAKEAEIIGLWNGLKGKASKRKNVLDEAYGQQGFLADSRDLLSWASDMRESLRIGDTPKDVNSAKQLIQEHEGKWEDIQTHNDRFDQLIEYGQRMVASNPRVRQLKDRVAALKKEKAALKDTWVERNEALNEGQDLQAFIRDAEYVDSLSASHEAFLSNDDLGRKRFKRSIEREQDEEAGGGDMAWNSKKQSSRALLQFKSYTQEELRKIYGKRTERIVEVTFGSEDSESSEEEEGISEEEFKKTEGWKLLKEALDARTNCSKSGIHWGPGIKK